MHRCQFILSKDFNEVECCTNLIREIRKWNRKKKIVVKVVVICIGKCIISEELGFRRICVLELILCLYEKYGKSLGKRDENLVELVSVSIVK